MYVHSRFSMLDPGALQPDSHSVFTGVDLNSGDIRRERFTRRVYRDAYDRMSQRLWSPVSDMLDAQHKRIC